jgi:hypothetical protein
MTAMTWNSKQKQQLQRVFEAIGTQQQQRETDRVARLRTRQRLASSSKQSPRPKEAQ